MFCKKCRREIKDSDKFCPFCGEKVTNNFYQKNKDKNLKKILISSLVLGIIAVAIMWSQSPYRIYYHLVKGNYEKANKIYDKKYVGLDDYDGKLYEIIINGLESAYEKYYKENKSFEEAIDYLAKVEMLSDGEIAILVEEKEWEIRELQQSRDAYYQGVELVKEEKYVKAIAEFDSVIERDSYYEKAIEEKEQAKESLREQIISEVVLLKTNKEYKDAVEILSSVKDIFQDDTEIQELLTICEQEDVFYQIVCGFEENDYDIIMELNENAEVVDLVKQLEKNRYFFFNDGDKEIKSGKALGIYPFEDGGVWFYYGDLVDGKREGQGRWFAENLTNDEKSYWLYEGQWENDYPNGAGMYQTFFEDNITQVVYEGNFLNGKIDGECSEKFSADNDWIYVNFKAKNGIPEEIPYEEIPETFKYINDGTRYIYGLSDETYEGLLQWCVYVKYGEPVAVKNANK